VIGVGGGAEKQLIAMTPLRSHRIASDIAPVAVFLTSEVSWLTGKIIVMVYRIKTLGNRAYNASYCLKVPT
jgi:hypothetical protein